MQMLVSGGFCCKCTTLANDCYSQTAATVSSPLMDGFWVVAARAPERGILRREAEGIDACAHYHPILFASSLGFSSGNRAIHFQGES